MSERRKWSWSPFNDPPAKPQNLTEARSRINMLARYVREHELLTDEQKIQLKPFEDAAREAYAKAERKEIHASDTDDTIYKFNQAVRNAVLQLQGK